MQKHSQSVSVLLVIQVKAHTLYIIILFHFFFFYIIYNKIYLTINHCVRLHRCRAPIASLDCMEEFNGGETGGGHCNATATTKEQLLTSCIVAQNQRTQQPSPGIRYRNLGKSGLRVSNVGLGELLSCASWIKKFIGH